MTITPPIKSQGIKTKLAQWIKETSNHQNYDRWVEPFMGTGAVAFNIQPKAALLCDSNPHLIRFYQAIQNDEITSEKVRSFLTTEGEKLLHTEGEYYYLLRERFNAEHNPLDFLFLSRACFNGMMRFNKKGGFNVPFCRKPNRFAKDLVTKITNQIETVSRIIRNGNYTFKCQDFKNTLLEVQTTDLLYCDPPYIGRHVDYYDSWTEADEIDLYNNIQASGAQFIMSTWLKNQYRQNDYIFSLWNAYSILTKEHFYHVGAKESNRNAVFEALLLNFQTPISAPIKAFNIGSLYPKKNIHPAPTSHPQTEILI